MCLPKPLDQDSRPSFPKLWVFQILGSAVPKICKQPEKIVRIVPRVWRMFIKTRNQTGNVCMLSLSRVSNFERKKVQKSI